MKELRIRSRNVLYIFREAFFVLFMNIRKNKEEIGIHKCTVSLFHVMTSALWIRLFLCVYPFKNVISLTDNDLYVSTGGTEYFLTLSGNMSDKPWVCPRCSHTYKWKRSLVSHLKTECGKEPQWKCGLCEYETKIKSNLTRHSRLYHSKTSPSSFSTSGVYTWQIRVQALSVKDSSVLFIYYFPKHIVILTTGWHSSLFYLQVLSITCV